jgi:glycosyltransferase involved in cell wall biosynthesis
MNGSAPVDAGLVCVVVPAWEEEGVLPGGDLFLVVSLLEQVRRDYPDRRIVLVPHPRQPTKKLAMLAELCELRRTLSSGALPAVVAVFDAALVGDVGGLGMEVVAYRPPLAELSFATDELRARQATLFDRLRDSTIAVRDLRVDLSARVSLRPDRSQATASVPIGAADSLRRLTVGLFTTVVSGAAVLIDLASPAGWLSDLAIAVNGGLRLSTQVDPGSTTVVLVDATAPAERLASILDQSSSAADVRLFHSGATSDVTRNLRAHGFRVFALTDSTTSWREVRDDTFAETLSVYAVRNPGAQAVSCYVHDGGLMGGAQRSHLEMVASLIRQGCMVHTIVPNVGRGLAGALRGLGCGVTIVPHLQPWFVHPDDLDREANQPATTTTLLSASDPLPALHELGPDLVITQSAVAQHAAVAAAILGVPHIWYLREFGDLDHGLLMPGSPEVVGGLIAVLSAQVVTNSAAVREHFYPGRPDRAVVIPPAPQVDPGSRQKESWQLVSGGVLTIGIAGSLQEGKGQATLARAAAELRSRGVEVSVQCFGDDRGSDAERLRELVVELGIADAVTFHGVVVDRDAIYPAVDTMVVASRHEAFGRVPFEAAAYQVPVVFADTAGPAEYLRDGVNGLAFEPGDVRGLADALGRLATDEALRRQLVAGAEALVGRARRDAFDDALMALVASVRRG